MALKTKICEHIGKEKKTYNQTWFDHQSYADQPVADSSADKTLSSLVRNSQWTQQVDWQSVGNDQHRYVAVHIM